MTRGAGGALVALALLAPGCPRGGPAGGAAPSPHAEARALIDEGQYDAALARLGDEGDAEALLLLGRAWAGKAGPARPDPGEDLRPEEQQALDFLERAVAADPTLAEAHCAIGDLLAPHALVRIETRTTARRGTSSAVPSVAGAERVMRAYGEALQADLEDTTAVNALIAFASRAGRLREAEAGFQELVKRDRENPDVLVRFGDFLAGPGKNPEAALSRYAQALIWRRDDPSTWRKMAAIHLDAARRHLDQREYPAAEGRLREARKFVTEPASPEAARLREIEASLVDVRGRR